MVPRLAAAMLVVLLLAGCANSASDEPEALAVAIEVVSRGDIARESKAVGTLIAGSEVNLTFGIAGEVQAVMVVPGDVVEEGAVLAHLDTRNMEAQLVQAQAAVAAARAGYSKAQRGLRDAEMEQVQAQVSQAEAAYEAARSNYERMKVLYDNRAISQQQLEGAELQFKQAEAAYISAQKQKEMAEEGTPIESLELARAQLAQAEAGLLLADTQLDGAIVKAPFSGTVSYANAKEGEMVASGVPMFGVIQTDSMLVELNVSERLVNHLNVGHVVRISVKSAARETFGHLKEVSPAADARTKGYKVLIEVANADGSLKPGMFASVWLPEESACDVLTIPCSAILAGDNNRVFVVVEGVAREKHVITGLSDGNRVEVKNGLSDGEQVVTKGHQFLIDGTRVRLEGQD